MKSEKLEQIKRTQRDYTMGFKLTLVAKVEKGEMTYRQAQKIYGIQGRSTVLKWLRKHGTQDWSKPVVHAKKSPKGKETPAQTIKRLERELADEKLRSMLYREMIDIADKHYGTGIKKKFTPELLERFNKEKK